MMSNPLLIVLILRKSFVSTKGLFKIFTLLGVFTFSICQLFSQTNFLQSRSKISWFDGKILNIKEAQVVRYAYVDQSIFKSSYYNITRKDSLINNDQKFTIENQSKHVLKFDRLDTATKIQTNIATIENDDSLGINTVSFSQNGLFCLVTKYIRSELIDNGNDTSTKSLKRLFSIFYKGELVSEFTIEFKGLLRHSAEISNYGLTALVTDQSEGFTVSITNKTKAYFRGDRQVILIHFSGKIISNTLLPVDRSYRILNIWDSNDSGFVINYYKQKTDSSEKNINPWDSFQRSTYKFVHLDQWGKINWNKDIRIKGNGYLQGQFISHNSCVYFSMSVNAFWSPPEIIYDDIELKPSQNQNRTDRSVLLCINSEGKLQWYKDLISDDNIIISFYFNDKIENNQLLFVCVSQRSVSQNSRIDSQNASYNLEITSIDIINKTSKSINIFQSLQPYSIQFFRQFDKNTFWVVANFELPPSGQSIVPINKLVPGQRVSLAGILTLSE